MDIAEDVPSMTHRRNLTPDTTLGVTPEKKRHRSGGIGQRLRTASDLETGGWIDNWQKNALKNLIMNGHEGVLGALERYAMGDGADLQHFIANDLKDTYEMSKNMDVIGDLDTEMQEGCTVFSRTCCVCHQQFTVNHDKVCVYHPESYSGETAQRWLPPGVTDGGGIVYNFYSCCGAPDINAPGCCARKHFTYDTDDAPGLEQRRPGMGL